MFACISDNYPRYNPPNETLEDFIERGTFVLHTFATIGLRFFSPHFEAGKGNRWQTKESLASMQLCTDVDG